MEWFWEKDLLLDHLSSDEEITIAQAVLGEVVDGRQQGRQARGLLLLSGACPPGERESNPSALELCYSSVKLGVEDLISPGSQLGSPDSSKSRAGDLGPCQPLAARQAVGRGRFRCPQ